MNNHTSIVRYSIGALSFAMAGCETVVPCDAEVGVCPRPEVGVVVNDAGVIKSIWLEEPEYTVTGNGVLKTICRGDLDLTPGEEVLFRGAQGFVVMEEKFQSPQVNTSPQ